MSSFELKFGSNKKINIQTKELTKVSKNDVLLADIPALIRISWMYHFSSTEKGDFNLIILIKNILIVSKKGILIILNAIGIIFSNLME